MNMKSLITGLMLAVTVAASAADKRELRGFSFTGTTNATGPSIYTNISYAIIPHTLEGVAVVKTVDANLIGSDTLLASAGVQFRTSIADELVINGTTAASSTNILVTAGSTNGLTSGDILVFWDKATDTYQRLTYHGVTSTGVDVKETITHASNAGTTAPFFAGGDLLWKMTGVRGLLKQSGGTSNRVSYAGEALFVGVSGRPSLVEAIGTNAPVLNVVSGIAVK